MPGKEIPLINYAIFVANKCTIGSKPSSRGAVQLTTTALQKNRCSMVAAVLVTHAYNYNSWSIGKPLYFLLASLSLLVLLLN